jgi:TPP-dependent pyruvate/acetoin dehydrogenase alpha subunit
MRLIREVETTILDLFSENKLSGTSHTCLGQEADAVGVINALDRNRDTVWSNHRGHGHFLAYSGDVNGLVAEVMGRQSGVCGGRGGSQHLCLGRFHSNGVLGGIAPVAVGTALADRDTGAITTAFLGDGTMGEGVLYEALNMAALWAAPVLFVVEDNGIAQTTPKELAVSGFIDERARPFGIRDFACRSTDVNAIHKVAREAIEYVRGEGKPAWFYLETVRLGPHSKGDDTRHDDTLAVLRQRDPLAVHAPRLKDTAAIDEDCRRLVRLAVEAAEKDAVACAS